METGKDEVDGWLICIYMLSASVTVEIFPIYILHMHVHSASIFAFTSYFYSQSSYFVIMCALMHSPDVHSYVIFVQSLW